MSSFETLTVQLVPGTDGSVDVAASQAAFASALTKRVAELETESTVIGEEVLAILADRKGQPIVLPTLCSMVASRLNAQPENFATLTKRVADYVRANAQGEKNKATGEVERPDSPIFIGRGKGSGVALRADMPVKSEK